jgi:hypothetical protein
MTTRSTKKTIPAGEVRSLAKALSQKPQFEAFKTWIIGSTPLITHSWSEKARIEMLSKQVKAVKGGKEARDPHADFVSSLYAMGEEVYGFPATGIKNCILSAAHKDKGVARSGVMAALWLDADMVRTRPALAGATCDMPLIRIFGSKPEMREDMVKVGSGLNKTASLAYRAQFTTWGLRITGRYNASVLSGDALAFLIQEAGLSYGIGEWRNERKGMFGAFHLATEEEEAEWEAYAAGEGDLPVPYEYAMAAE